MRSPSPRAQLATASVAVALAAADTYVVVLALPDMMAGVGLGLESLQRATPIVSGFLLGYITVLPLIGRLADLVDRQRVLLGCLAVFVLGSAVTALAVELPVLVGGRVLQGIGGGGLVPATLALVADLWPVGRRGMPLGVVGAVQELGSVFGPLLGALVLAVADWRAIFWLNAGFGLVLALALRAPARMPRASAALLVLGLTLAGLALWAPQRLVTDMVLGAPFVGPSRLVTPIGALAGVLLLAWLGVSVRGWWRLLRRADLPGALLIGVALGSVVLTFASADPEREVVGPSGRWLLPLTLVAAALAVLRHLTAAEPLFPRGLGRVVRPAIVSTLVGVALVTVVIGVPLLARLTGTQSQVEAALVLARFLVAVPAGAVLGGWALNRFGTEALTSLALALAAIGLFVMGRWGHGSLDQAFPTTAVLVLVGLGIGLAIAPVNAAALERGPAGAHGVVSAVVVVARMTGMVLGLALVTGIGLRLFYQRVAELPDPTDLAALGRLAVVPVQAMFTGGAVAALLGAATALGPRMTLHRSASPVSRGSRGSLSALRRRSGARECHPSSPSSPGRG
ncbi:MAG TPA: MFS transporter [Dermatophilaceae bacterium]|nr:MFS transporter [Dermatophilaceae bacterium]